METKDVELLDTDFEKLDKCPWDGENAKNAQMLYVDAMGGEVVKCGKCGLVYAKQRLNNFGLEKYWSSYYSRIHIADEIATNKRKEMYDIDYRYISSYISCGRVLDVGCGDGTFMEYFERNGFETFGVEFGAEAAEAGKKKHTIYYGRFPDININCKFDLIIFRGVLQYLPNSKLYLNKAIGLLNEDGIIFITAQPNMDSLCFKLFKEKFTQPVNGTDFCGYNEPIITKFMIENRLRKIGEKYFYEETPYADLENDVRKVDMAIMCKKDGLEIPFLSPPFWGNMMSIVYENRVK